MILPEIHEFLGCRTPAGWIKAALADQDTLLIDHKNCEFKAASTALSLIAKYHSHVDLINMMSRLAREELVHHEQVMRLMKKRLWLMTKLLLSSMIVTERRIATRTSMTAVPMKNFFAGMIPMSARPTGMMTK